MPPAKPQDDALLAFLEVIRQLTRCSMVVALWQRAPEEVVPLCSAPSMVLNHTPVWRWRLPALPKDDADKLQRLSTRQLPSMVTAGLPFSPGAVAYVDCSAIDQHAAGGFLLLWADAPAPHPAAPALGDVPLDLPIQWLRPVYAQLLDIRQASQRDGESAAQFHHVFDSVPQGIVVLSASHAKAQVNAAAAALFGLSAGWILVDVLAQAMHDTRARCDNAAELELAYTALQGDLDAEIVIDWHLDDRVWRVDTHPILHSGHKGRVWLFADITAQVRLESVLRMEAHFDSLTGLFNRRAFFDRAQRAFRQPLTGADAAHHRAVLLFDIDHFKKVNDQYGHPAGDRVLKEVARRAKSVLRDGDLLARYGGEEFIVLLAPTPQDAARAIAERLRAVMDAQLFQLGEQAIAVRISVGLALRGVGSETLQQTIERADANLYRAKRSGRNRVVCDGDADEDAKAE